MTELAADSAAARPTVFLSYASEDRDAARALQDALPAFGIEVWYDESELGGGEAWDQKIRRRIRDCDYFMPLISAQTERRAEGYFRREWRLAVERTLDMADDHLFLLPIVIDDTDQAVARVPEKFLTVQWLKVPGGQPTRALELLGKRLAAGGTSAAAPTAKSPARRPAGPAARDLSNPVFPLQEPGQPIKFWVDVAAWAGRSVWVRFKRLRGWLRVVVYIWIAIVLISRCSGSSRHEHATATPEHATTTPEHAGVITPAKLEKLKAISQNYQGAKNTQDVAKLGAEIAKQFNLDDDDSDTDGSPLLAIAFTAPPGDASAAKLANSTFALAYGMLAISHQGQVAVTKEPLASPDLGAAVERGKALQSKYVLVGAIETVAGAQVLTVKIAKVADGSVVWSKSYNATGADPAKIGADVDANIPAL